MMAHVDFLGLLNLVGLAVFALTGAIIAARKHMDIIGFGMLGTVTGIGGGTIRDVLLDQPVSWLHDPTALFVCLTVSGIAFFVSPLSDSNFRRLLIFDAVGLTLFAVGGTERALAVGVHWFVAVIMGVITATFGGIVRDVLGGESPLLLRRDIYITAALVSGAGFVLARGLGMETAVAAIIGLAAGLALRLLAIFKDLSLPSYRRE